MGMETPIPGLEASKARLDELKSDKGRLSRLVGEARKSGTNADELIAELQQVSSEIKQLQKQVKQQLNGAQAQNKWTPKPITIPPAVGNTTMAQAIAVEPCADSDIHHAEAYVARHPAASVWHRPCISSFISKTYGHNTRYLCAYDDVGGIVGVLPLVQLNSRLFGNFLVSMPYFNYGGVLADCVNR